VKLPPAGDGVAPHDGGLAFYFPGFGTGREQLEQTIEGGASGLDLAP
jgi:hypothetical protein